MEVLYQSLMLITWKQIVMFIIGGLLIWLCDKKEMEPALLLPMALRNTVNLPLSGAITQVYGETVETGIIDAV